MLALAKITMKINKLTRSRLLRIKCQHYFNGDHVNPVPSEASQPATNLASKRDSQTPTHAYPLSPSHSPVTCITYT